MRRYRQGAVWAALLALTLTACGANDETTPSAPDATEFSEAGLAGKALYDTHCSMCHKSDLTGAVGPALGAGSEAAGEPIDTLRLLIVEGGAGMPTWGGRLEEGEIDDLITFLSESQGR